jgi:hypothetical protein
MGWNPSVNNVVQTMASARRGVPSTGSQHLGHIATAEEDMMDNAGEISLLY